MVQPNRKFHVAAAWLLMLAPSQPASAQRGPAVVEVLPVVVRQQLAPTQSVVGTIGPPRTAIVGSAVDGRVTELLVREGDRVEKDQPLASLLTETIKLELEAAEAELEFKRQALAELENGSRPEELAQTSARLEATRVAAEYLERNRKRVAVLGESSAVSVSEYEDAVSLALEAQQRYEEAQAAHNLALAGPRPERIAQARAQVAMQDAIVRRLSDQIKKHTMYSRFAGYVSVEHTEVGQWLARGEPVAEIIELDEVDVVVKVLESYIPFVHVGDRVQVGVTALPEHEFAGTVAAIIPQADVRSRTFPVKIRVQNQITSNGQPLLKAGMLARADLPLGETPQAVLVPKDALVFAGDATLVWTIDRKTMETVGNMVLADAIAVNVRTGASESDWIEVLGDLSPDALIVTRGNERIPPARPGQSPSKVTWAKAPPPTTSASD